MEAVKPPPAPGTDAFNKLNSSLDEALAQNPRARRDIARSSDDNLVACTVNTAEPSDMPVPPPFTPPGKKAGEGAQTKTSSTVMRTEETAKETDAPQASLVQHRPPVPPQQPATLKDKEPCMVDEASMRKWSNDMLKGHPAGHATTWEQLSNSLGLEFKGTMDTMSQSLRIKEDAHAKMFQGKEKALRESKGNLKKIKNLEEQVASLMKPDDKVKNPETDIAFL